MAFSIFLLNSLRRLPCRVEPAGLRGASSALRFIPAKLPLKDVKSSVWVSFTTPFPTPFPTGRPGITSGFVVGGGVRGGVGTLGDSGGGGMMVPSVMLPKLKSSAGSSKRGFPEPLTWEDMSEEIARSVRFPRKKVRGKKKRVSCQRGESCLKEGGGGGKSILFREPGMNHSVDGRVGDGLK